MSAAAKDLGVTHSAISKQIALLEDWFGKPLITRQGGPARTTKEAQGLASELTGAFESIHRASEAFATGANEQRELEVIAPTSFAMQWLVPRLPRFQSTPDAVPVRVQTTQSTDNWLDSSFDFAICRSFEPRSRFAATPFLDERLTLIASPTMALLLAEKGLESLQDLTLLTSDTRPRELEDWLEAAGLDPARHSRRQRFSHYYVALHGVLNDLGPGIGPMPVLADLVQSGRLVIPFPSITIPGVTYSIVVPEDKREKPGSQALALWIKEEAQASIAKAARML